tara:strand:- start:378 stop:686 length:309 start_codon:yes stop_codon:yes gene_type:complete
MSLAKFKKLVLEQYPTADLENTPVTADMILELLTAQIESEQRQYREHKECNQFPFGKYKGMDVSEVMQSYAGKSYIDWILKQDWFTEAKFSGLFADIKKNQK